MIQLNQQRHKVLKTIKKEYQLWLLALPVILFFLIFHYLPMYGVQIGFKDFIASKGITGSPWVGFKHFERFFSNYQFVRIIKNTIGLSLFQLIGHCPFPIIFALLLNQVRNKRYKKVVQTVTYAPHFISTVVLAGMVILFLSPSSGIINHILSLFGVESINFMSKPEYYKSIYVISGIWQNMGWKAIIYIAALSSIDPALYEAARMDGAGKLTLIRHIDIPSIMPTTVIMLIMDLGRIMNMDIQKSLLLQNDINLVSSEIVRTYVYKVGLIDAQYSYSAAVGLFNSVINIILLITVNQIAKRLSETSVF